MVTQYLVRDFLTPLCNKESANVDECLNAFRKIIDILKGTSFVVERPKKILGHEAFYEVEIKKVI